MRKKRSIRAILERRKKRAFSHEGEVLLGKVVGVHGLKGELKVKSESDVFDRQIEAVDKITLYRGTKKEELPIEEVKPYKDIYLIKFKGIDDRSAAEEVIGGELWIKEEDRVPLEEGEFYYEELIGLPVYTEEGEKVGVIKSVFEQPASHILEVEREDGKTILIPFIEQFVKEVDLENKKVLVSLLEGMEG
ncbi:ribosome maturation factor RimM [Thermovibrio sp.]